MRGPADQVQPLHPDAADAQLPWRQQSLRDRQQAGVQQQCEHPHEFEQCRVLFSRLWMGTVQVTVCTSYRILESHLITAAAEAPTQVAEAPCPSSQAVHYAAQCMAEGLQPVLLEAPLGPPDWPTPNSILNTVLPVLCSQ